MKKIALITNAGPNSGVGSRAYNIAKHMPKDDMFDIETVFIDGNKRIARILPKSIAWIQQAQHVQKFDGYDITNQSLSFIASSRKPAIVTVHDIIEKTNPQSLLAMPINAYLLSGIKKADHVIAVSEYVKQEIMRYYNISDSNISVIYNGVDSAFHPDINNSKLANKNPIVVSVGSDHPRKNLKTTLQVIALLKKTYPDILLIRIGSAGLLSGRKEFLRLLDELNLQKNVQIIDPASQEQLVSAYRTADALLMPSYQEGFGMPILEAFASGCPVVCSNTTSLPEIADDAAILHDPDDINAFARSVSELFESGGIKESYIQKGLIRAQDFSWEKSAQQVHGLYKKIFL
ncbi:MAG: glycosyltransferase family 1 protein [Candidatus Andersenbacteria bacterium]